jgi:hypothetical protein
MFILLLHTFPLYFLYFTGCAAQAKAKILFRFCASGFQIRANRAGRESTPSVPESTPSGREMSSGYIVT